ncbi:MAG: dephospho-CoA kinase [Desulfobacteraceae bacterium]|nr:MAG: dephospho-CoA kinase [Desulfobacteraceae bacterium]
MVIAVTGGIASGKSTVSRMLEQMGAPLIDLDVLARHVVEPGKHAWKEIVDYFGEGVLLQDGRIDRKKLSNIVFRDQEKRKKLESLTHPRILDEMYRQVDEIASRDPNAIIQVGIPLLFELNLQYRFHKTLLVYARREVQQKRLMERDGISESSADDILDSQMPIDEKFDRADFVIRNEGTVEETREQVEALWIQLKEEQRKRKVMT